MPTSTFYATYKYTVFNRTTKETWWTDDYAGAWDLFRQQRDMGHKAEIMDNSNSEIFASTDEE